MGAGVNLVSRMGLSLWPWPPEPSRLWGGSCQLMRALLGVDQSDHMWVLMRQMQNVAAAVPVGCSHNAHRQSGLQPTLLRGDACVHSGRRAGRQTGGVAYPSVYEHGRAWGTEVTLYV
jgi:hypothetical protein